MECFTIDQSEDEPITLAEMRYQMGITSADDTGRDQAIMDAIQDARAYCETYTRMALIEQTKIGYSDVFCDAFKLTSPIGCVYAVRYYDADDVLQVLSADIYQVDLVGSRVLLKLGRSWPDSIAKPNAIEIEFMAGANLREREKRALNRAIIIIVNHWERYFEISESASYLGDIPNAATRMLNQIKDWRGTF